MSPIIPPYQPVPFPLPLWLIEVLLVVGFLLHLVPMNIAWMGTLISGLCMFNENDGNAKRLGRHLLLLLPVVLSFAITQGIVPLLFLQLEYGPLYYTSSIIMALPWILLLVVLMAGYYGLYWVKNRLDSLDRRSGFIMLIIFGLFSAIGFTFTNNMTLMLAPEKWGTLIDGITHGAYLSFAPEIWIRYAHSALGALAVSALGVGGIGLYFYGKDKAYGQWLIQMGSGAFLLVTLVNVFVGMQFLMSQNSLVQSGFAGGFKPAMITLHSGYLLTILAALFGAMTWKTGRPQLMWVTLLLAVLTLADMAVMRHFVRTLSVAPVFHPEAVLVKIQWDLLIAFLILAAGLLVYLGWLIRLSFQAASQPTTETPL